VHVLSFAQGHDAFNAAFFGKNLPNTLSHEALVMILIATPIISFLAGLVPAVKACRLKPSEILRAE
jgi:lipoprotein-releasing system permease protein